MEGLTFAGGAVVQRELEIPLVDLHRRGERPPTRRELKRAVNAALATAIMTGNLARPAAPIQRLD